MHIKYGNVDSQGTKYKRKIKTTQLYSKTKEIRDDEDKKLHRHKKINIFRDEDERDETQLR